MGDAGIGLSSTATPLFVGRGHPGQKTERGANHTGATRKRCTESAVQLHR